ncbi:MAG: DEAD/DEAH box helicase [Brevinematia bacterium]
MKIILEFKSSYRHINELVITFKEAKKEFLECLRENSYSSFWGFDLLVNTKRLSGIEKQLFYYLLNSKGILFRDINTHSIVISTPIDTTFLYNIFHFKPILKTKKGQKQLSLRKKEFSLGFIFINNYQRISVENIENLYLLPAISDYFIIDVKGIVYPVKNILSQNVITEIFEEGSYYIDEGIRKELIYSNNKLKKEIEKYITLPEIINVSDGKIFLDIYFQNEDQFELFCFVKKEDINLKISFDDLRQKLIFNEDLVIELEKNKIAVIGSGSELYERLKSVNSVVQANFFRLLDEIKHDKIISSDTKTLFTKILPELGSKVSFLLNGEISNLLSDKSCNLSVNVDESTENDWLSVNFKISIGEYELTIEEMRLLIEKGFIRKGNIVISLPQDEIKRMKSLLDRINLIKKEDSGYVRKEFIPLIISISEGFSLKLPEKLNELREKLYKIKKDGFTIDGINLPDKIKKVLREYQKTGVYWLYILHQYGFGGVLADEMGLGKSLEILSFLYLLKKEITPSIIISPSALVNNWAEEIKKFFGEEFRFVVVDGNKEKRKKILSEAKNYEIIITSYNLLMQDEEIYEKIKFVFCILDEAQHIKNKDAKRTRSVKKINAKMKIALTGTPLENYPIELWSIFDFIMPDYLGNHRWFKKHIENPILKDGYENRKEVLQVFQGLVSPYILRRTKDKVLKELPPKIEQDIEFELTEKQKIIYLEILNRMKEKLFRIFETKGLEKSYIDFLAALTRLRQVCIHPGLIDNELFDEDEISVKLQALMELIYEIMDSNRKVVVYSQFVEFLKFLKIKLYSENIEYLYLDGRTKDRPALVQYFNTSQERILLASIKAGGVGLNITGADSVIIIDPWWNPAVETQAIDRLHRIGQKSVVFAYRLLTKGTVEGKMRQLQLKKKKIISDVIDLPEEIFKTLSISQIEELFSYNS